MKTNKEFVKIIIATVQLKTLIRLLKVQESAKLTDKEKDVQKEVNELIPEIINTVLSRGKFPFFIVFSFSVQYNELYQSFY